MKIILHKHDLIISSSVGSGHSDKYSYVIPHKHLSGRQSHLGKIISIKYKFNWLFPFSHTLRLYQGSFVFGEASSSHFFRVTTSAQQLLFGSSYFFRAAVFLGELLFQNSRFFAAVIFFRKTSFSEQNVYGASISFGGRIL